MRVGTGKASIPRFAGIDEELAFLVAGTVLPLANKSALGLNLRVIAFPLRFFRDYPHIQTPVAVA